MLASINGRYAWPYVPALAAAAGLFILSGARVGADPTTRGLDLVVAAAIGCIGLQIVPLPASVVRAISPATPALQDAYALVPFGVWRPISIHPEATREALELAITAALIFWAARESFTHGGTRAAARLLACIGFACALVSLAQHATAPATVLWKWTLPDARVTTFGPFVNRDHLATWLVLAISLVAGYLTMHVSAHAIGRTRQGPHATLLALSGAPALVALGSVAAMLVTLAATLSRSGFIALVAAVVVGTLLARPGGRRGIWVGVSAAVAMVVIAAWMNLEGLTERLVTTLSTQVTEPAGRLTIWRETIRLMRAFPVFGTGGGTFADAMFVYQQTARQVLFNQAHNEYLQVAVEGGAVMLALVVTGLALLARAARLRLADDHAPHRFVRIGACAGLAAVCVQSLWETGLRAPANLLLAAVLAGLAIVSRRDAASEITPA